MKARKKDIFPWLFLLIGMVSICFGSVRVSAAENNTICNGVYINDINISGMTKEEAQTAVDSYVDSLKEKEIGVVLDDEVAIVPIGDLGYTCKENAYIDEALNLGKTGNLIKRYKELKDVENVGMKYELEFILDDAKIEQFIADQCSIYDIPAKNATVSRVNGQFVYEQDVTGRKLNVEATKQAIADAILKDWNHLDLVVDAVIEDDVPQYDYAMVQKCDTLLGSFNTNYSTSTTERKNNIANAAKLINNSVVYPGEIFSCYEKMNPFTVENGYYSAHAYVNGMVEDSIGGGVCQVSTTLYNAVLRAELEIVERAAHSMTVSYVPIAFDAAIAGTYKDLKFKNNLQVPVLIEAIANGTTITFNVYGCETRDVTNRKIEFKSEVISKTEPPKEVVTKDPSQPTSYRKVTQSAYTGYVAIMYKYVYENGVLVDTIQVNKSSYKATPAYVIIGTKEEVSDEDDKDKVEDEDKDKVDADKDKTDADKDKDDKKPSHSKDEDTDKKEEAHTSKDDAADNSNQDKTESSDKEATSDKVVNQDEEDE